MAARVQRQPELQARAPLGLSTPKTVADVRCRPDPEVLGEELLKRIRENTFDAGKRMLRGVKALTLVMDIGKCQGSESPSMAVREMARDWNAAALQHMRPGSYEPIPEDDPYWMHLVQKEFVVEFDLELNEADDEVQALVIQRMTLYYDARLKKLVAHNPYALLKGDYAAVPKPTTLVRLEKLQNKANDIPADSAARAWVGDRLKTVEAREMYIARWAKRYPGKYREMKQEMVDAQIIDGSGGLSERVYAMMLNAMMEWIGNSGMDIDTDTSQDLKRGMWRALKDAIGTRGEQLYDDAQARRHRRDRRVAGNDLDELVSTLRRPNVAASTTKTRQTVDDL